MSQRDLVWSNLAFSDCLVRSADVASRGYRDTSHALSLSEKARKACRWLFPGSGSCTEFRLLGRQSSSYKRLSSSGDWKHCPTRHLIRTSQTAPSIPEPKKLFALQSHLETLSIPCPCILTASSFHPLLLGTRPSFLSSIYISVQI